MVTGGLSWAGVSVFCRHNRFTADCPICSKGTVLDAGAARPSRRRAATGEPRAKRSREGAASPAFSGPHASAGPYEDEDGERYVVRLERVPGGVRLAEWAGSQLRVRAPVLPAGDLPELVSGATGVLTDSDAGLLAEAIACEPFPGREPVGVSRGRSGDFREELRVEPATDGRVRVGRWVQRPGAGWELRDAAPMLPAARFAEALRGAAQAGLIGSGASDNA
jgi:hypothetical protein